MKALEYVLIRELAILATGVLDAGLSSFWLERAHAYLRISMSIMAWNDAVVK